MIETRNLSVAYGKRVILNNINLTFVPNSVTALVGPNGCGKSTLLKAVAGLQKPRAGQVLLDGHPIANLKRKAIARKIAYMAQAPIAPEGLTLRQLVEHGAFAQRRIFRQPDHQEINLLLESCGLRNHSERHFTELSGGEKQRAWIAMCLLQKSTFLLLDEPTSSLDLGYQIGVLKLLANLHKTKCLGVIMVLHDINQAAHFADNVIALKHGEVVEQGPPRAVLSIELVRHLYGAEVSMIEHPENSENTIVPNF